MPLLPHSARYRSNCVTRAKSVQQRGRCSFSCPASICFSAGARGRPCLVQVTRGSGGSVVGPTSGLVVSRPEGGGCSRRVFSPFSTQKTYGSVSNRFRNFCQKESLSPKWFMSLKLLKHKFDNKKKPPISQHTHTVQSTVKLTKYTINQLPKNTVTKFKTWRKVSS